MAETATQYELKFQRGIEIKGIGIWFTYRKIIRPACYFPAIVTVFEVSGRFERLCISTVREKDME